jgi:hypothetical protein
MLGAGRLGGVHETLLGAEDEICRRNSRGMAVKASGSASAADRCAAAAGAWPAAR